MAKAEVTTKPISERHIQTVSLMVLAGVAGVYLVFWLRPVLVPFVVACFIVSGVGPILAYLEERFGVSRLVAAGMTFLFGVGLMGVFGLTIWVSIIDLSANAPDYRNRIRKLVVSVEERFPMELLTTGSRSNDDDNERSYPRRPVSDRESTASDSDAETSDSEPAVPQAEPGMTDAGPGSNDPELGAAVRKSREASKLIDTFVRDGISVVSQAFVSLVSTSVVVLIYVFFLLLGKPAYTQTGTGREIDAQIRGYLSLKTVISIGTGAVFGITLRLFGVPMAMSFGVLAFLLNFIPNIGPIVASLLPVPLILLDPSGNIVWMVCVIAATVSIQLISGNVVEPKLMGDSSDLHPVTILLALMFWGMMWGIIGMFLATPITAAIKIVMERFEPTKKLADIMAGRWDVDFMSDETDDDVSAGLI